MVSSAMPLWTREEARQWAKKGAEVRWSRQRIAAVSPEGAQTMAADLSFPNLTLGRVRAQVTGILDLLDKERCRSNPDGQRLNWLAAALERLAELERVLDGRPMPGTLRPSERKPTPAPKPRAEPLPSLTPPSSSTTAASSFGPDSPLTEYPG